jgi:hypothetical protein
MYLYASLRDLSIIFGWLRGEFIHWGNAIKGVWLIGPNLSVWIFSIANFFGDVENAAGDVAEDWKSLYNWLIHNLGVSSVPADLLRYADDLISFIKYPFEWIADTLKDHFPELYKISREPIEWVLETIYRYTGLDIDFVDDPRRVIRNLIKELTGDLLGIARDPIGWLVDQLNNIIPDFWRFIYDARGWIRDKIEDEFPFLMDFIRDPDEYIENKLINFLEDIAETYRDRAIKIFEKVLAAIF